ncbi:hypothetical protein M0802_016532, partial [Mischocyttarus mexicanus]
QPAAVLEKVVSRDKVSKKTKTKNVIKSTKKNSNSSSSSKSSSKKYSIAGKVWETLAAVRKSRGPNGIVETALIVHLDRLNVPPAAAATACNKSNLCKFEKNNDVVKDQQQQQQQCPNHDKNVHNNFVDVLTNDYNNKDYYADFKNDVDQKLDNRRITQEINYSQGEHRGGGTTGNTDSMDDPSSREEMSEMVQQNISSKPKTSNINRSESYKERIHHK